MTTGLSVAVCVVVLWSSAALGGETELRVGEARRERLAAGAARTFTLTLGAADFARIRATADVPLIVRTYDPAGQPFRGGENGLDLVADTAGEYRVEVRAKDPRDNVPFSIVLEKVVPFSDPFGPPKAVVDSGRMRELQAAVRGGSRESVAEFWDEIRSTGAPLIEPIAGDREYMAVTFLWRGGPKTRNVMILWWPMAAAAPGEYLMDRLDDTDVWYRTIQVNRKMRLSYSLAPNAARLRPVSLGVDAEAIAMIAAAARPDPLNPRRWRVDPQSVDAPEYRGSSVLEMPDAPPQPWTEPRAGAARGRVERLRFRSAALKNEREVGVYLPAGYSRSAEPYPVVVVFEAHAYLGAEGEPALIPTPTILDNLIEAGRIPAAVGVFIGNAPGARGRELGCSREFTRALSGELLPWVRERFNFTSDARRTVVAGSSLGGLAAACAGLFEPGTFGNVLVQSGAFHWLPPGESGEPNWVARQFISETTRRPLPDGRGWTARELLPRIYMEAGSAELDVIGDGNSILSSSRALRDVLRAKGYSVEYREFQGGHDYLSWRGTLAGGLIALLGGL